MQRLDEILKLVSEFEKIDVNSLSEKLQVSKVTIRKDLDKLESKGLLHREHGYAVLNSGDDINVRLSFQYDTKKRIAREAAKLIKDNDTVLIESGSTCALLAEEICQTKKNDQDCDKILILLQIIFRNMIPVKSSYLVVNFKKNRE